MRLSANFTSTTRSTIRTAEQAALAAPSLLEATR